LSQFVAIRHSTDEFYIGDFLNIGHVIYSTEGISMTISKPIKYLALTLTAIAMLFGLAACKTGHHQHGARMGMFFDMIAYKLDFSDEQEEILEQIKSEFKTIKKQTAGERKERAQALITLIEAEQLDTEQVSLMMEQRYQRMKEHSPKIMELVSQLHSMLTEEQKEKIIRFINKRQDKSMLLSANSNVPSDVTNTSFKL